MGSLSEERKAEIRARVRAKRCRPRSQVLLKTGRRLWVYDSQIPKMIEAGLLEDCPGKEDKTEEES